MFGLHFKRLYLTDRAHVHPNIWLYNFLLIFQGGFISYMFEYLLSKFVHIKMVIVGGLIVFTVLYIYETWSHGIFVYNEITNTVMLVLFVFYSLYYYYNLLKDDRHIRLIYSADFWWVTGLLFFYFGSTACDIFFSNIPQEKAIALGSLNSSIFKALIVILYGCWSYSFICRRWLTKISVV